MLNVLMSKEVVLNVATDVIHIVYASILLLMMYTFKNVPKQGYFVYRHTIRSGDWSMRSFVQAMKMAIEIYQ